jgi:hypothetical protein
MGRGVSILAVGTLRRGVPGRVQRAELCAPAMIKVAPLNAARTSQRDVPTWLQFPVALANS